MRGRLLDLLRRLFGRSDRDDVAAQMDELRRALEKQIESDERWTGGRDHG